MEQPTLKQLECLISWPAGSVGEQQEMVAIAVLLSLCRKHGFGRVPQLACAIEDIWRNPDRIKHYAEVKSQHLDFMEKATATMQELTAETERLGLYSE